uniref:Uncharacterized protein n=1 Tax=Cryptomonas curvata TaxID=233186 RepID=A0A7S0MHB1_9CRYP
MQALTPSTSSANLRPIAGSPPAAAPAPSSHPSPKKSAESRPRGDSSRLGRAAPHRPNCPSIPFSLSKSGGTKEGLGLTGVFLELSVSSGRPAPSSSSSSIISVSLFSAADL